MFDKIVRPPKVGLYSRRGKYKRPNVHSKPYWDALKKEFQSGQYQNIRAYNGIEREMGAAGVEALRSAIHLREARYRHWLYLRSDDDDGAS